MTNSVPDTMRAWRIHRFGGPESLQCETVPVPLPTDDEVLVRVCAASVNPVDIKTRDGKLRTLLKYRFPLVLGNDLSGVVVGIGSAVTRFKIGDAVYSRVDVNRLGAFAEFTALRCSPMGSPVSR